MHTFIYARVSTTEQTTANQLLEIETAGYAAHASYADTISGKTAAMERPEFAKMIDAIARTRTAKRLVVTKLDRLGRDVEDVLGVMRHLEETGCAVKVLQFGDLDLTSPAGRLVLTTLAAVAQMERDLLVERTHAGLARARREGKRLGRPPVLNGEARQEAQERLAQGESVSAVARALDVSRATVLRARDAT
ncbi:MAG: recombinase family protein [Pseudomonadota bacterium]